MKCSSCGGPFHPATGHAWSEDVVLCGVCARSWWVWLKLRMNHMSAHIKNRKTGKKMKESFHEAALKSIGAKEDKS